MLFLYGTYTSKKGKTNQINRELIVNKSLKPLLNKRFSGVFLVSILTLFNLLNILAIDDPDDKVNIVVLDAGHGERILVRWVKIPERKISCSRSL